MANHLWWLNANGLVDGEIPAGKPCPWFEECKGHGDRCPGVMCEEVIGADEEGPIVSKPFPLLYDHSFSCALARMFSLLSEQDLSFRR